MSEYGIVPRKSNILTLPYMNWDVLLGIFDGDGSITKDKRYENCYRWTITSGSTNFIEQVISFLSDEGIVARIQEYSTDSGHWFNVVVTRGEDIYKIYCNLYKNSPYFLTRKKEKFGPLVEKFTKCNSVNSVNEMEY